MKSDSVGPGDVDDAGFPFEPDEVTRTRDIIGDEDDRVPVSDDKPHPWHSVVRLEITRQDDTIVGGTGWFASPTVILTAGHCVYDRHSEDLAARGWAKQMAVYLHGSTTPIITSIIRTTKGWKNCGDKRYDYGAVVLSDLLTDGPEPYHCKVLGSMDLKDKEARIAGYPQDKPTGSLWEAQSKIKRVETEELLYDIDTIPGESGAPVLMTNGEQVFVVGLHHWGAGSSHGLNRGIRLTDKLVENIEQWSAIGSQDESIA